MLWFFGITFPLLWAIDGPIARWGAHYGIDTVLADLGMQGDCKVKGTLTHGFTVSDFSYQGNAGIQDVTFSEVSADYRLLRELIHGKVRSLTLSDAVVVIDLDKFKPSETEDDESTAKLKETIALVHQWVSQPEISLSEIDVQLLKSGEQLAKFNLEQLHHPANSSDYTLTNFQAQDGDGNTTPLQHVTLIWHEYSIDIDRFEVLPDIALEKAHANWAEDLKANAEVQILSANLSVTIGEEVSAKLVSGAIDAQSINDRFDLNLPLNFSLNSLDATVENWMEPMPDWRISCALDLEDIEYQEYKLGKSQLKLTQSASKYQLELTTSLKEAPLLIKVDGSWSSPQSDQWWASTEARYNIECSRLSKLPELASGLPKELNLADVSVDLVGQVKINELALISLDTQLNATGASIDQVPLPGIQANGNYQHLKQGTVTLLTKLEHSSPLKLDAQYSFEDDAYTANLSLEEQKPIWINKILESFETGLKIENSISLQWSGNGHSDLDASQTGKLELAPLTLNYNDDLSFEVKSALEYKWPQSISVSSLELKEEDFLARVKLDWDGQRIKLTDGHVLKAGQSISTLSADIPITREVSSLKAFLAQEDSWQAQLELLPLQIQKINQWLRLHEIKQLGDLEGSVSLGLELFGSPHAPNIKGFTRLDGLRGIANKDLAPLQMLGDFETNNKRLSFNGVLNEATTERMTLDLSIPFTPLEWVRKSENLDTILEESTVTGELKINTLPLKRAARFVPQLKEITGHLDGSAQISGNLLDPKIELDTRIEIPKLVIAEDKVDDVSDILITCKANSDREVTAKLKATINGGQFQAEANANLTDLENPTFSISAKTDYAMVFRNDAISVRANTNLKLEGTLEDALLSGEIGFVESLFYKDIDILPIGVPSSAVSEVELPAIDSKKIKLEIPEPFDKWKLDVKVAMKDPLLIRGNIAGGQIEGGFRATGTLAEPSLNGTIFANKVVARLPFSTLHIQKGKINFTPGNGLIPTLDIQGKSTVNNYDTSIFIYGPATDPRTTFTSYPPLPKNDIMTLLATGVTAQGLSNNKEAATLRALQLFLAKIKQESGQSRSTKILELLLSSIDDFEFNINEPDGFTGRKFSSAKIKLNKRIYITAQVDEKKQTRGLVVFVLKFR